MPYTRLYLLVEGDDDERFVNRAIVPLLSSRYDFVHLWKYAQQKPQKVTAFLRSIRAMSADYYLLTDINGYACFPEKKLALLQKFPQLDSRQVLIVIKEIESWYLAGLPNGNPWGVSVAGSTSDITKEQFDDTIPTGFDSRIDYMIEILKLFDVETARARNPSFRYFAGRCGIP